jgi:hypothetical protein
VSDRSVNDVPPGAGETAPGGAAGATSAASIVAAAERLAAEITHSAEAEANTIRSRAVTDSDASRAAIAERVRRLAALAVGIDERLGEMRAELDALSGSLGGSDTPDASVAPAVAAALDAPAASTVATGAPPVAVGPETAGDAAAPSAAVPPSDIDDAGARLIALNLALSDTPRDEATRQLRDQVPDPERLVDEVYASVQR